jgi:putative redox protein
MQSATTKVNASALWCDGERFVVNAASGHAFVVDADRLRNTGVGPMELVLIGLCACTATDVVGILRKKRIVLTGLEVRAEAERTTSIPAVYERIMLIYRVAGRDLPRKFIEDAVRLSEQKYCSVASMLSKTATISYEIEIAEP